MAIKEKGQNTTEIANKTVSTTAPSDGQILKYVASAGEWQPAAESSGAGEAFKTISVAGQSDVVADAAADTLTLAAGSNVTITTTAGTDTVTIAASGGSALNGIDDQSSSNDDQITITDTAVVINEDGDDVDFRVEGDTATSLLHCDAGNDRVGIGTNAPSAIFEIVDDSDSATGKFIFDGSVSSGYNLTTELDDTGAKIGHNSGSRDIQLQTNSTTRLTILGGGNVGVGTTSPGAALHIHKDLNAADDLGDFDNYQLVISGGTATNDTTGLLLTGSGDTYGGSAIVHYDTGAGQGDLAFLTKRSGSAEPPTESLRLKDDGRAISEFTLTAWITFDGTGTVSITDSYNCSSLTDNGTGDYTVTFTVAMANANYAAVPNGFDSSTTGSIGHTNVNAQSTTTFDVTNRYIVNTNNFDVARLSVIVAGGDV